MADKKALEQLIEEHGGVLIRSKKHQIYLFPNGKKFTAPNTPRCPHAYANAISSLRRILGLNKPNRGQTGERVKSCAAGRERQKKAESARKIWEGHNSTPLRPSWKEKLFAVKTEVFSFEEIMANNNVAPNTDPQT